VGGIQAKVFHLELRIEGSEFGKGNDAADSRDAGHPKNGFEAEYRSDTVHHDKKACKGCVRNNGIQGRCPNPRPHPVVPLPSMSLLLPMVWHMLSALLTVWRWILMHKIQRIRRK